MPAPGPYPGGMARTRTGTSTEPGTGFQNSWDGAALNDRGPSCQAAPAGTLPPGRGQWEELCDLQGDTHPMPASPYRKPSANANWHIQNVFIET